MLTLRRRFVSVFALLALALGAPVALAVDAAVTVHTDEVANAIDPHIYGHFFEHIYHSANGGLWGEVVWNRSFEQDVERAMGSEDWSRDGDVIAFTGDASSRGRQLTGGHEWRDHDYTVEVRKTGGAGGVSALVFGGQATLTLGSAENTEHTLTQVRGFGRGFGGGRGNQAPPEPTPLADPVKGSIEDNRWYSVRIRAEGRHIQAWLDGDKLFDVELPERRGGGRFGGRGGGELAGFVGVGSTGAQAEFRNFVVKGLDGQVFWDRPLPARQKNSVVDRWSVSGGTAEVVDERGAALNDARCLQLTADDGETVLQQDGFALRAGDELAGSIWLKGSAPGGAKVRLVAGDDVLAEATIAAPTDQWQEFPLALKPTKDAAASLRIVFTGGVKVRVDQVSLMPASARANGGFRTDMYAAFAGLKPTVIRWPGGCYAEQYKWQRGIGPQKDRTKSLTPFWEDYDPNALGTDEFMELCRRLGSDPLMVINTGMHVTGTNTPEEWAPWIEDACHWVEYCNGPADSEWGKLRAANGHPEPYHVKFWEIDNELWRSLARSPEVYAKAVPLFSAAMKQVDPSITIIAHGGNATDRHYDQVLVDAAAESFDVLSIHHYTDANRFGNDGVTAQDELYADVIEMLKNSANPKIKLYVSEWNAQTTDWRTGLYAGGILNTFEKYGDTLTMGGPALMAREYTAHGWDNAFINFDEKSWYAGPNYVVMKLWRDNFAPTRLKTDGGADELNLIATKNEAGDRVILKAVNPAGEPLEVTATLDGSFQAGGAQMQLVAPGSLQARNSFAAPDAIRPEEAPAAVEGNRVTFALPAYSAAVVRVSAK